MATATQVLLEPGDHVVQFYENEDDLVSTAGAHLTDALGAGDAVIVVATAAHRDAFAGVIAEAGLDLAAARASGSMLEFDAADMLARLMVDGAPDAAAFDAVVGGAVSRAGEGGRRVRVYGEMVALLWDADQVTAAIALEELWNRLRDQLSFSLLCAYGAELVAGDEHAVALASVCQLHTAVVAAASPQAATNRFPCTVLAPRDARRFVGRTLQAWGCNVFADDVATVVTELASNAVVHGRSDFEVTLSRIEGGVRVAVHDASLAEPVERSFSSSGDSGRGLIMVAALASRWGHDMSADGKQVWAEFGIS
jgi:anti-sigma regulatory factor (Ser/Thr protein kinase)